MGKFKVGDVVKWCDSICVILEKDTRRYIITDLLNDVDLSWYAYTKELTLVPQCGTKIWKNLNG